MIEHYPTHGTTLLYNAFSGGIAVLDERVMDLLRRADRGETLTPAEWSELDPDLFDESVGVLVQSHEWEEAEFRRWHEESRSDAAELSSVISVTFACNLRCTYCCQEDVRGGGAMTESVGQATAEWHACRALELGSRQVSLAFVGGEPLLAQRRIEQVVVGLNDRLLSSSVSVRFSLITNGVFLTRELIEHWLPIGLVGAQVTLDGDESTHSLTRRSSRRGDDSFSTIYSNVVAASELIDVTIRGNYQDDTAHGFLPLIKKLASAGFRKGSRIRFVPALTTLGAPSDSASGSCTWGGSSPELMLLFSDEIRRAGFDPGDPIMLGPCGLHRKHTYAVDPGGNLYKCPGFLGHPEWTIGHVSRGLSSRYDEITSAAPMDACGSCAHRPHCGGGCVAAAWRKHGRPRGVTCELDYFERAKSHMIARKHALIDHEAGDKAVEQFPPPEACLAKVNRRSQ